MAAQQFGVNDAILLASLLYSCVDLLLEWDVFNTCSKPIHQWLLLSYACVIGFRVSHIVGSKAAMAAVAPGECENSEFLLDLRHKAAVPRAVVNFTWTVALPFFAFWTVLGTSWLWNVYTESPMCVPSPTHLWFSVFWLILCYVWILVHAVLGGVALTLERRLRLAESDLRAIEDPDLLARWGQVSRISGGYRSLTDSTAPTTGGGLTPAAIKALPCGAASSLTKRCECSICLTDFEDDDTVRILPGCGHTFHRSCIDLWLLRSAECPLCKRHVSSNPKEGVVIV